MFIAFESHEQNSKDLDEVSAFAGAMEQRIRSIGLSFCPSKETVLSVVKVFSGSGSISAEVTQQQFEDAVVDVATEMHSAFCTYISYKDVDWYLKYLRTAERALSVADAMLRIGDRVENAEKIITSLFLSGSKEAPREQLRASERLPQSSAQSSKPFKTIAIILAIIACLVGICAAISSRDWEADASAAESTSVAVMQQTESDRSDDYVYVTPSGKKYHKQGCWTLSKSKSLTKLTVEEAENKRYDPCSICSDD